MVGGEKEEVKEAAGVGAVERAVVGTEVEKAVAAMAAATVVETVEVKEEGVTEEAAMVAGAMEVGAICGCRARCRWRLCRWGAYQTSAPIGLA